MCSSIIYFWVLEVLYGWEATSLLLRMLSKFLIEVFRKPSASVGAPAFELDLVLASDMLVFVSSKLTTFFKSVSQPST